MFNSISRAGLLATTLLASGWAHAHDHAVTNELKQFGQLPHGPAAAAPESGGRLWGNLGSQHSRSAHPTRSPNPTSTRDWRWPTGSTTPRRG